MTEPCYIDTSCMLKLLVSEPQTARVEQLVSAEDHVAVSTLTELETRTRLLALRRGGQVSFRQYRLLVREFDDLCSMDPFHLEPLAGAVFDTAITQVKRHGAIHCRSLDRIHLAAMQSLGYTRLLTSDGHQAKAAASLEITVVRP